MGVCRRRVVFLWRRTSSKVVKRRFENSREAIPLVVLLIEHDNGDLELESYLVPHEQELNEMSHEHFLVPHKIVEEAAGFPIFSEAPKERYIKINKVTPRS